MGVASLGALGEGGTSRPSWGCFLLLLEPAVHFICILLSPFSKFKAESSGFWRELPPGLSPQGHLALSPSPAQRLRLLWAGVGGASRPGLCSPASGS